MVLQRMASHDELFRHIFSNPEHAAGELRHVFRAALGAAIDWATLTLEPGTFVDEKLRELRSDLLFSAQCGGRRVLIYFLMEHQSTDDRFMALRLLGYMVRIWEDYRRAHPEATHLPPILPVVVCHDDTGWRAPRSFVELLDIPADLAAVLAPQIVSFEMVVDDLSAGVTTSSGPAR